VPTPNLKAQQRFNEAKKPTVAVINEATAHNDAFARRIAREREEMSQWATEGQDPRIKYQRELDRWWQSKLDAEAALDDGYEYSTGYKERRYKTTCHRGPGDPDYGI
jgi:hypothetical protein